MEEERAKGFYCFGTVYDTMKELVQTDEHLAFKFITAVMEYGLYGEYDESDTIINALMQPVIFGIDNVDKRREKNIEDGQKGGRKRKNDDKVVWEMIDSGKTKEEVAKELKCSVRTIQRSLARRSE